MAFSNDKVTPHGNLPLYEQTMLVLQSLIKAGGLSAGDRLPSERELREKYNLSSTTVRRALLELEKAGLIYRHHGLGTFIASRKRSPRLALLVTGYDAESWRQHGSMIVGQLVGGVCEASWEHDAIVSVMHISAGLPLKPLLSAIVNDRHFDGVLLRLAGEVKHDDVEFLETKQFPYVVVRRYLPDREINCVISDWEKDGFEATDHLIRLNHRRIGLVLGPRDLGMFRDREQGYIRALKTAGLPIDPDVILSASNFTEQDGYIQTKGLFAGASPPKAILVAESLMCIGAYAALRELGLRIPEDVAVVGSDDGSVGDTLNPPLTAITTPLYDVGVEAAKLLLETMETGRISRRAVLVESRLILRESCGARLNQSTRGTAPA